MARNAFDAMNNAAGNDMFATGGAIFLSEYENNMSPNEQTNYEELVVKNLVQAYNMDPHRGDLDYQNWLKTVRSDLIESRSDDWDGIEDRGSSELPAGDLQVLKNAGALQKLAHLHTGRVEDIIEIAINMPQQ